MKTRIFALLLAVVCLFSLAACKKDTAYSLYEGAKTTLSELKGYEATTTTVSKITMGSTTMDQEMTMAVKVNGNNFYAEMEMDDEKSTYYYIDGVVYEDMGEYGKTKYELAADKLSETLGLGIDLKADGSLPELTEEDLKEIELVEDGDNRTFTVALDKEAIEALVGDDLASMMEEGADIDFSNMSFSATFDKDDKLVKMSIKYELTIEVEMIGEMSMSTESIIEFKNLGEVPTVSAPADADSYEEVDLDDIF